MMIHQFAWGWGRAGWVVRHGCIVLKGEHWWQDIVGNQLFTHGGGWHLLWHIGCIIYFHFPSSRHRNHYSWRIILRKCIRVKDSPSLICGRWNQSKYLKVNIWIWNRELLSFDFSFSSSGCDFWLWNKDYYWFKMTWQILFWRPNLISLDIDNW